MKIKKVLDIFKEHGFDENNCSFFRQEDINDIAKDVIAAINYTHCCTELKTFDIHECINEVTKSANKLSPWIVDARKDRSFRYRVKKAIDKMLYSN